MLERYQAEGRGDPATVRETLAGLGVASVVHDPRAAGGEARNEPARDRLLEHGGRDQIPFPTDRQHEVDMYAREDVVTCIDERHR